MAAAEKITRLLLEHYPNPRLDLEFRTPFELLVAEHRGRVPRDADALARLPGVGRKTANMVLGNAFGRPAIAVDTHVLRVSGRLGLASAKTARSVERQLADRVPEDRWTAASNALILHGRQVCTARDPHCCDCALNGACAWPRKPDC